MSEKFDDFVAAWRMTGSTIKKYRLIRENRRTLDILCGESR